MRTEVLYINRTFGTCKNYRKSYTIYGGVLMDDKSERKKLETPKERILKKVDRPPSTKDLIVRALLQNIIERENL